MLKFTPSDPFPLLNENEHSYLESRVHAAAADTWLGLRVREVESRLAEGGCRKRAPDSSREHQQLWFGLEEQSLLTPYVEIRRILANLGLRSGDTVIDLGAAYGRMGFIIQRHHPGVQFIGYEYVGERVEEGRRCLRIKNCDRARLEHADLTSPRFRIEPAKAYFIYDYGTPQAIEKTLHDLRRLSLGQPFLLVGRGRHCRYAIECRHSWLKKAAPEAGETRVSVYYSPGYADLSGARQIETGM